ncbi:MAG: hypothetical protein Q4E47_03270 [Candidatus Saccharibacteria bacterium]|nr:hypothetical protein [Candidatus Saccharibacteria bacterium]
MAKTKNKKCGISKKSRIVIAISVAVVVAGLTLLVLLLWKPFDKKTEEPQDTPETSEEQPKEEEKKEEKKEEEPEESDTPATSTPQTPAQYEGPSADEHGTITGNIAYVGYGDDDYLLVQTTISQHLGNEGTCKLTMTEKTTGTKIIRTVKTTAGISTSECSDFKILNSHVPSGEYNVIIEIEGSGKTGRLETTTNI